MLTDAWLDLKLNWCHLIIKKVEFEAHLLYRAVLCVVGVEVTRLWYVSHYKLFQRLRGLNPSLFRRGFFNVRISAGIMIDRSLKKRLSLACLYVFGQIRRYFNTGFDLGFFWGRPVQACFSLAIYRDAEVCAISLVSLRHPLTQCWLIVGPIRKPLQFHSNNNRCLFNVICFSDISICLFIGFFSLSLPLNIYVLS